MATGRYKSAGVNYDILDAAKRTALAAAATTAERELESHGEPAFVFKGGPDGPMLATVLECLGTKSVIAREYVDAGGPDLFRNVGIDGVAAIVNDLICVGALPLVVHAYFATGSAAWYDDQDRFGRLVEGWREGCEMAGAVWGGGESPTLAGLVAETDIEIAGSAVGFVPDGEPILGRDITVDDEIVLVSSSGLHTNGASLVRALVHTLPRGYRTLMPRSGREFGAGVLDPSPIYTELVAELRKHVPVTYYSHITGHGLRKLMRADREFTYHVRELPPVPEVLSEIQQHAGMSDRDAYGTLNMGVGLAVFCAKGTGTRVVEIAAGCGLQAIVGGEVQEGPRRVVLEPVSVTFEQDELRLRRNS
jgi:phosphoribosylformylglycinamidine cyclo-ligase